MSTHRTGSVLRGATRAISALSELAGWVAAAMIVAAVGLTCAMIAIRFVFNGSTVWQTEAVVYLMVAATLLGLAFVQKHRGHVAVDLVPLWLGPVAGARLEIVTLGLSLAVALLCLVYGYDVWHLAWSRGWTSDTVTRVPLWIPYLSIPVGFGLFALQLLADLVERLRAHRAGVA